jgi:hypothetical protein
MIQEFVPEVKRLGRGVDNSSPTSTKVKNEASIYVISLYAFMAWAGASLNFSYNKDSCIQSVAHM